MSSPCDAHTWERLPDVVNNLGDGKTLLWDKCASCEQTRFVVAGNNPSEGTTQPGSP